MPFPGGLSALPNGTLLLSFIAAAVYLMIVTWEPSPRRTAAKTLSTALLAVLAYLQGGPALLVLALVLSSAGDAFLAHDGDRAFLGGLGSFLGAHIAYVALFWAMGGGFIMLSGEAWRGVAAIALVAFSGFMAFRLLRVVEPGLKGPVAVYIAAILAMGLTALTLDRPLVLAGAAMFIASDTCLASEKFLLDAKSPHRSWISYAVWALYYLGQVAITLDIIL